MGANAQTSVPAFQLGQVLTAQQVTEINTGTPVFAGTAQRDAAFGGAGEKTLAEGQLAYIEALDVVQMYDGANWVKVGPVTEAGLTLIVAETFTSVPSVTIANCFSAAYDDYLITSQTFGLIYAQLRTGSTTADTNYQDQFVSVSNTTYTQGRQSAQSSAFFAGTAGQTSYNVTHMFSPFRAAATTWETQLGIASDDIRFQHYTSRHTTATSYESLVLTVSTGTTTGVVRIYGLQNS